jgi:hypothetical protein
MFVLRRYDRRHLFTAHGKLKRLTLIPFKISFISFILKSFIFICFICKIRTSKYRGVLTRNFVLHVSYNSFKGKRCALSTLVSSYVGKVHANISMQQSLGLQCGTSTTDLMMTYLTYNHHEKVVLFFNIHSQILYFDFV